MSNNIYKYLFYATFVFSAFLLYVTLYLLNVFSPLYEGTVVLLYYVIIMFLLVCVEMTTIPIKKNKEENKDDKEI